MHRARKTVISAVVAATAALAFLSASPAQAASNKPAPPSGPVVDESKSPDRGAPGVAASPGAERALAKIQDRIIKHVATHRTENTFVAYVDSATGKITLVTDAPDNLVSSLTDMKGEGSEEKRAVSQMRVSHSTMKGLWNRRDDIPAYYGGGGVRGYNSSAGGTVTCSSGYAVKTSAGTRYMVTAGHCFDQGAGVRTESGANYYGAVSGRRYDPITHDWKDMEAIGGQSYAGRIFTGGLYSTTSIPVVSAGEAVVGYTNYCHSGRTTGENCGHTANSINAVACYGGGCIYPAIAFTGGVSPQPGDSGSPFYAKDSSGSWIRGHIVAGNGTTTIAEKWTKVASTYGVSIVTG